MTVKYALPLTFLFAREGQLWASLACEISVASYGDSVGKAREMLKEAAEAWVSAEAEQGRGDDLSLPVEADYLAEFMDVPREDLVIEYHASIVSARTGRKPAVTLAEFTPCAVPPACCIPGHMGERRESTPGPSGRSVIVPHTQDDGVLPERTVKRILRDAGISVEDALAFWGVRPQE